MGQLPTYEAYQAFAEGMDEYYFDYGSRAALPHFYRAFALDSTFFTPLFYAYLVHNNLGEYVLADSLLRLMAANSDQLSEYERHLMQYQQALTADDFEASLRPIRRAAQMAPQSKAVYNLAHTLQLVNRPREVLEVMATVDPERGAMRGWWLYWWKVIVAHHMLGDHARHFEAVGKARQQYPDQPTLVYAEVVALAALGQVDEARRLLADVEQVLPNFHFWVCNELRTHGHPEVAQEVSDWTVEWLRARPPAEAAQERHRYLLAWALYVAGRWHEARPLFEGLATEPPDSASYRGYPGKGSADYVNYLGFLGVIAARLGDSEMASDISRQLAAMRLPFLRGGHTEWRARIAAVLGQREEAVRLIWEVFRQGSTEPFLVHFEVDYESLQDYPPFQEFMRPKG
jgi:tetratricopeptide (TPR) repeat protein